MGQDAAAKAIVGGAFNSAGIIANKMKENIVSAGAYDTGLLYKSISRKRVIYDRDGVVNIITGVSKSVKGVDSHGRPRVPYKYAHIVEKHKPFAHDAGESTKQEVVDNFVNYLENKIKKYLT